MYAVVSELSEIMTVMVDEQKVSPGGTGYTVSNCYTLTETPSMKCIML